MDYRRYLMISWKNGRDFEDGMSSGFRRACSRRIRKTVKRAVAEEISLALEEEAGDIGPYSRPGEWTAYYAPARSKGEPDPSKGGFQTKEDAWRFVFDGMCGTCRAERDRALAMTEPEREESPDSLHPPCACEWFVLQTEDFRRAEDFGDILEASGFTEVIYQRPG